MTKISGKLIRLNVERERWFAGVVFTGSRNISVSGPVSMVPSINSDVILTGEWVENEKYGPQFKFSMCEFTIPTDRSGVVGFLTTIPHIGDIRARLIVDRIGLDAINKIIENPECIRGIAQIGDKAIEAVRKNVVARKTLIECETVLAEMGVSASSRRKVADEIGEQMSQIIKEDPRHRRSSLR